MTARYLIGDVLEVLPTLEAGSVDLVLTSPPFLALRSYLPADHPDKAKEGGSQATPGAFIDWLVDVVEALDRVLAPHGSMVIELGDTYAGSGGGGGDYLPGGFREGQPGFTGSAGMDADAQRAANAAHWRQKNPPREISQPSHISNNGRLAEYADQRGNPDGMRDTTFSGANTKTGGGRGWPADKSLTLIPELFRMTLVYGFNPLTGRQTKRWRLRNVVRWVRPNPPVGALGDKFRPATSELMVFCRTDEAGRRRYFDLDAVREPYLHPNHPSVGKDATGKKAEGRGNWSTFPTRQENPAGAPPLDWWNIPPGGYEGAHYAVWPPELLIKPIKAMSPEKVCRTCGEPSRRITQPSEVYSKALRRDWGGEPSQGRNSWTAKAGAVDASGRTSKNALRDADGQPLIAQYETTGWSDCGHDNYRPGLVLDPFAGSGTTLAVAVGHGRDAVGIDLDERNARLAEERIGFFLEVVQ